MSGPGDRIAVARAMVGVPFRLHGRDGDGVDCVGLAAMVLGREAPRAYGLRSGDVVRAERWLSEAGLRRVAGMGGGAMQAGDLMLVRPGPLQLHVMIHVPGGFVHAHAGLRRVVEMPGPSPWPIVSQWRAD